MHIQKYLWAFGAIVLSLLLVVGNGCNQTSMPGAVASQTHARPTANVLPPTATPASRPVDSPLRLIVPSIHVDATIENVGILSSGDLATPEQNPWTDVGWYSAGPLPGERGSAVIDGHLDRPGGSPAVFWDLRNAQPGDAITVMMSSGKILHFHVTRTALYPPQDAPLQGIFGDTGGNYLNLITCAGDWVPSQHQTTLRMVVYASLG